MNKTVILKARTRRNFTKDYTNKYPDYEFIDLVWFFEPVQIGETVQIKWNKDSKETHQGIIIKKYTDGYWTILTDQQ